MYEEGKREYAGTQFSAINSSNRHSVPHELDPAAALAASVRHLPSAPPVMLGYRHSQPRSSGQLLSLERWQQAEGAHGRAPGSSVDEAGDLLEFESLELRLHPPNVSPVKLRGGLQQSPHTARSRHTPRHP
jgi:hypothetical protein